MAFPGECADVFPHLVVKVLLDKDEEVIEALDLDRLDEPLDVGIEIRPRATAFSPQARAVENIASNSVGVKFADRELPYFTQKSGIAPASFVGDFQNQFMDRYCRPGASHPLFRLFVFRDSTSIVGRYLGPRS